jgi:hypothetical protein
MAAIGLLMVLTWAAIGVNIYDRHKYGAGVTQFVDGYIGKAPPKHQWHNEEVPLDGFDYEDCVMKNVTFVYDGKTPIQFSGNKVNGFGLKSGNPAILIWNVFLKAADAFNNNVTLILPLGTKTDLPYEPAR